MGLTDKKAPGDWVSMGEPSALEALRRRGKAANPKPVPFYRGLASFVMGTKEIDTTAGVYPCLSLSPIIVSRLQKVVYSS